MSTWNGKTIAFVTLEIYPATPGGVGILISHTITNLLKEGYRIVLLLDVGRHEFEQFAKQDLLDFENGYNLSAYLVDDLLFSNTEEAPAFANGEIGRAYKIHVALDAVLRQEQIDLVEFYDYCGPAYFALSMSLARRPRIAVRLHNTVELIARKIRGPIEAERVVQFAMERTCLQSADLLLTPGWRYYDEEVASLYPHIDRARVALSPPVHYPIGGIDYDEDARTIVFYGRLSTFKGLDTFLRAAVLSLEDPSFREWLDRFVIIGPEETVSSAFSLDEMKEMIPAEFTQYFEFTGRIEHVALLTHLQSAAFACFANRMESFCYAAHELHTAGVPLLLSDTPAFRDHFEEGEQAEFFDGSSPDLSRKMIGMSGMADQRRRLSQAGPTRAPRYDRDHYAALFEHCDEATAEKAVATSGLTVTCFILSDGNPRQAVAALDAIAADRVIRLSAQENGPVRFAGMRWQASFADGSPAKLNSLIATDAALFIRDGDVVSRDWLRKACERMALDPSVGAVGGWLRKGSSTHAPIHHLMPELGGDADPGLRTLIRLRPGQTYQEAICNRSNETESSLIIEHRHEGRTILQIPEMAADITEAVPLPSSRPGLLAEVDFDRFSRDVLAADVLFGSADTTISPSRTSTVSDGGRRLRETAFDETLVVLSAGLQANGQGETLILRYFSAPDSVAQPWSSVVRKGQWTIDSHPTGPVHGALKTNDGSIRCHVAVGGRIDLLCSPNGGRVDVFFRGTVRSFDLRSDQVYDLRLHFGATLSVSSSVVPGPSPQLGSSYPGGLSAVHDTLLHNAGITTVYLGASPSDFAAWPDPWAIRAQRFLIEEFDLDGTRPMLSDLHVFVEAAGASHLVISSRVAPSEALLKAIDSLPRTVRPILALTGAGKDGRLSGTAARFQRYAQWLHALAGLGERVVVSGGAPGALALFASRGIKVHRLGGLLPELPETLFSDSTPPDGVAIAVLRSESVEDNLLHMISAVHIAAAEGLKIRELFLPRSYFDSFRQVQDLNLLVRISWYDSIAQLAPEPSRGPSIALACYPDEEWPDDLRTVTRQGWLPIAGATTEFDDDASLARYLAITYWEDALDIGEALNQAIERYDAICGAYSAYAMRRNALVAQQARALFGLGDNVDVALEYAA